MNTDEEWMEILEQTHEIYKLLTHSTDAEAVDVAQRSSINVPPHVFQQYIDKYQE